MHAGSPAVREEGNSARSRVQEIAHLRHADRNFGRGTACFGGSLSNQWTVRDFSPNEYLPRGVRLAGYFGDAADLPREAFQEILDAVATGRLTFPVDRVYDGLEQVPKAHDDMEHDRATGKLVVRVRHEDLDDAALPPLVAQE